MLNRANGNEHLFRSEENYYYFLKKYKQHITPIAQTLAWCLLPNHYHFLVRIKPVAELKEIHWQKKKCRIEEHCLPEFIMQQFSSWQNSYAKAFNKVYSRKGSLFMDYMRRVEINKDLQLGTSTFYIHKNPIHHGYANKIGDWPFFFVQRVPDKAAFYH